MTRHERREKRNTLVYFVALCLVWYGGCWLLVMFLADRFDILATN